MRKYFLVLLTAVSFFNPLKLTAQNIDVSILKSVYGNQTSFKDNFFKADAQSVIVFNVAAPVSIFAVGLIKHDKQMQRDGLFVAGAYVLSTIVTQSLKPIIKRERPFIAYPQYFSDRYDGGGYSFPSGHTSAAFCTATSLSLYFPKWYVIAPSYLWAASVGWARMYEGVHYPSDVLAGAIVGAGSAWIGYKVEQKWNRKKPIKHPSM
jgi:membrane-associated phospholipid phosphatase